MRRKANYPNRNHANNRRNEPFSTPHYDEHDSGFSEEDLEAIVDFVLEKAKKRDNIKFNEIECEDDTVFENLYSKDQNEASSYYHSDLQLVKTYFTEILRQTYYSYMQNKLYSIYDDELFRRKCRVVKDHWPSNFESIASNFNSILNDTVSRDDLVKIYLWSSGLVGARCGITYVASSEQSFNSINDEYQSVQISWVVEPGDQRNFLLQKDMSGNVCSPSFNRSVSLNLNETDNDEIPLIRQILANVVEHA